MRVGDHQLDAAQAPARELAQECEPEGLGLRGTDLEAEHLAPAVGVDGDRHDHGNRDDAALLAHLHVGDVEPEIWPVALQRSSQEGLHVVVDLAAQPADLALRDAAHAERLDQVVDQACRDALHLSLLDYRRDRLPGQAARLKKAGEVTALAQLRDPQFEGAGAVSQIRSR
jgi:hypothetical protein